MRHGENHLSSIMGTPLNRSNPADVGNGHSDTNLCVHTMLHCYWSPRRSFAIPIVEISNVYQSPHSLYTGLLHSRLAFPTCMEPATLTARLQSHAAKPGLEKTALEKRLLIPAACNMHGARALCTGNRHRRRATTASQTVKRAISTKRPASRTNSQRQSSRNDTSGSVSLHHRNKTSITLHNLLRQPRDLLRLHS